MSDSSLAAVAFGLLSAMTWGAGDFYGGLASKRGRVTMVVVVSQLAGVTGLVSLALFLAEPLPPATDLVRGAAAGIFGAVGLLSLYRGLAGGRMSVVAPIAAIVTGLAPVVAGLWLEGMPSLLQLVGFGAALAAVWLISRSGPNVGIQLQDVRFSVVAGLGFGLFLVLIGRVSSGAILWPLVAARVASIGMLSLVSVPSGYLGRPETRLLGIIVLVGLLDAAGNAFYALAAREGRLDIAAVLSSLYPASTVMLSRLILDERLSRRQWVGVAAALGAVLLLAT
jgi:drug/metabolite transporter (DMT)-like permease